MTYTINREVISREQFRGACVSGKISQPFHHVMW